MLIVKYHWITASDIEPIITLNFPNFRLHLVLGLSSTHTQLLKQWGSSTIGPIYSHSNYTPYTPLES